MSLLYKMLRDECLYLRYSRGLLVLLAVLLATACMVGWNATMTVRGAYHDYIHQRVMVAGDGQDPDAMLDEPVHTRTYEEAGGGLVTETDNPVRESYEDVVAALDVLAPSRLASLALGAMALLVGPLAFSTWGAVYGSCDYSNKTVKVRATQGPWRRVVAAKLMANTTAVALVLGIALLIAEVGARVVYWYVGHRVGDAGMSAVQAGQAPPISSLIAQYAVAVFVAVLFSSVGLCLGILFRRPLVPLVIVVAYNLFVPSLGKYDLKNATAVVVRSVFSFGSDLEVIVPVPLHPGAAAGILAAVLVAAIAVGLGVAGRQSKYVT